MKSSFHAISCEDQPTILKSQSANNGYSGSAAAQRMNTQSPVSLLYQYSAGFLELSKECSISPETDRKASSAHSLSQDLCYTL